MTKDCERWQARIQDRLDGTISPAEDAALEAHLAVCPECRALYDVLAALPELMAEDAAEPPAALADGVMSRIYAWEETQAGDAAPDPVNINAARTARKTGGRAWGRLAVAACLVLVIGGGVLAGKGLFASKAAASGSITLESAQEAPAPWPEAAPVMDGITEDNAAEAAPEEEHLMAAEEPATDGAVPEEAAEGETADAAMDTAPAAAAPAAARRAPSTWEDPDLVPAGREEDFQALIQAAPWPEGVAAEDLIPAAAVEYNGIIYEFLTDEGETLLFWRDAAESVDPIPSPAAPAALWDILG